MTILEIMSILPQARADLEALIEEAIARLDFLDGDSDFEPECWDEGAQVEDGDSDLAMDILPGDFIGVWGDVGPNSWVGKMPSEVVSR